MFALNDGTDDSRLACACRAASLGISSRSGSAVRLLYDTSRWASVVNPSKSPSFSAVRPAPATRNGPDHRASSCTVTDSQATAGSSTPGGAGGGTRAATIASRTAGVRSHTEVKPADLTVTSNPACSSPSYFGSSLDTVCVIVAGPTRLPPTDTCWAVDQLVGVNVSVPSVPAVTGATPVAELETLTVTLWVGLLLSFTS